MRAKSKGQFSVVDYIFKKSALAITLVRIFLEKEIYLNAEKVYN